MVFHRIVKCFIVAVFQSLIYTAVFIHRKLNVLGSCLGIIIIVASPGKFDDGLQELIIHILIEGFVKCCICFRKPDTIYVRLGFLYLLIERLHIHKLLVQTLNAIFRNAVKYGFGKSDFQYSAKLFNLLGKSILTAHAEYEIA